MICGRGTSALRSDQPNITALDISNDIKALGDEDWKKEKDAENAETRQHLATDVRNVECL